MAAYLLKNICLLDSDSYIKVLYWLTELEGWIFQYSLNINEFLVLESIKCIFMLQQCCGVHTHKYPPRIRALYLACGYLLANSSHVLKYGIIFFLVWKHSLCSFMWMSLGFCVNLSQGNRRQEKPFGATCCLNMCRLYVSYFLYLVSLWLKAPFVKRVKRVWKTNVPFCIWTFLTLTVVMYY